MAYRIIYGVGTMRKQIIKSTPRKWRAGLLGVIAAVLAVSMMVPQAHLWIRDLLLPGDEDITAAALEGMASDLSNGETVREAVEAFCKEILAGGT